MGKTFLATALGHAAVRRRYRVHFKRTDSMLRRLKASRLDNSHDAEVRKLLRVDLLILDDFALSALDPIDTAEIYELIVERHRSAATIVPSNRDSVEWLALMADPLLAQSAIDRSSPPPTSLSSKASLPAPREARPWPHRRASTTTTSPSSLTTPVPATIISPPTLTGPRTWSHATGERVVPSPWRGQP